MEEVKTKNVLPFVSEKFIDSDNLEAYYYAEKQLIHFIWKQRSLGEEYRQPFRDAFEYTKDKTAKYFLSDIREQGIVGPDDRKWFEEEGLPLAVSRGLVKAAVVFEGNIFKQYYINMILKHFNKSGVPMKFFKSLEHASEWLLA